jgi:DNA transformation protein and related proteins
MSVGAAFLQYVLEQLERLRGVRQRRMFGGVGLYCDDVFFGLIDDDTLYFKVDDTTRPDYESRGMQPLRPFKDKPEVSMTYYTVPADVLDDAEELVSWARRSVSIAGAPKKPARKKVKRAAPRKKVVRRAREKRR